MDIRQHLPNSNIATDFPGDPRELGKRSAEDLERLEI